MQHELLHIEDLGGNHEGHRVLCLRGPLLISNLFEFQSTVRANTTSFLILDLTQVPYVDSAGVGALVGAYVTHDKGRRLALVGVTERVRNTMQVAHIEQFFEFYKTAKAAQDAHEPSADLSKGTWESSATEADGPGRKSSHLRQVETALPLGNLSSGRPAAEDESGVMNRMLTPGERVRYRAHACLLATLPSPSGFCGIQEYEGGPIFYVHESDVKQDLVADVIWNEKSKSPLLAAGDDAL